MADTALSGDSSGAGTWSRVGPGRQCHVDFEAVVTGVRVHLHPAVFSTLGTQCAKACYVHLKSDGPVRCC